MRPRPTPILQPWLLIVLTTLLIISVFISTAAVVRMSSFISAQRPQRPQPQRQQTPLQETTPQHVHVPPESTPKLSTPSIPKIPPLTPEEEEAAAAQPEYKYFHEAGANYELTHYDARYFPRRNGGALAYAERQAALHHLVQSYLSVFASLELETWLAHGSLLGWFWNARNLPYDADVDAQVSGETMLALVRGGYNGTMYRWDVDDYSYSEEEDKGKAGGGKRSRSYLLDINPFSTRLERGTGLNLIDARWIDTETGVFVDITALMERNPRYQPGVLSCKNNHSYRRDELYPLRETKFEGVTALVPWDYRGILVAEYHEESLVRTEWEG